MSLIEQISLSTLQTLKDSSSKRAKEAKQVEPYSSSASPSKSGNCSKLSGRRDDSQQQSQSFCNQSLAEITFSGGKHHKLNQTTDGQSKQQPKSNNSRKEKSKEASAASMIELVALRASEEESRQALHAVRLENIGLRDSQTKLQSKIKTLEKKNGELTSQVDALQLKQEKDIKIVLQQVEQLDQMSTAKKLLKQQLKKIQKSFNEQKKLLQEALDKRVKEIDFKTRDTTLLAVDTRFSLRAYASNVPQQQATEKTDLTKAIQAAIVDVSKLAPTTANYTKLLRQNSQNKHQSAATAKYTNQKHGNPH